MSIIFALKNDNELKKLKYLGKRGTPRNILQKYVLKGQMNNPELWESVIPTDLK